MVKAKRIALLIESSTSYGRSLIRGVLQYANVAASWFFYNEPRSFSDALPNFAKHSLDGIIMRDTPENMKLLELNVPTVVSIRYLESVEGVPIILGDSKRIGRMAARYFQERGFRNFAYCGFENMPWSLERERAFAEALPPDISFHVLHQSINPANYEGKLQELSEWLKDLPKPAALMACNDVRGESILEACKLAEVKVPFEISILGVNNDDMICDMVSPQLSSIALNITKAGYQAAKTLDKMIKGESYDDLITIEPERVVARASSDIFAVNDPEVAKALYFIDQNSRKKIHIDDLAAHVGINRRALERKFKHALNSTIYSAIKRAKIDAIRKMLTDTDIQISEIAYAMGFDDANHISRYFKQEMNVSPMKYRKKYGILHMD